MSVIGVLEAHRQAVSSPVGLPASPCAPPMVIRMKSPCETKPPSTRNSIVRASRSMGERLQLEEQRQQHLYIKALQRLGSPTECNRPWLNRDIIVGVVPCLLSSLATHSREVIARTSAWPVSWTRKFPIQRYLESATGCCSAPASAIAVTTSTGNSPAVSAENDGASAVQYRIGNINTSAGGHEH